MENLSVEGAGEVTPEMMLAGIREKLREVVPELPDDATPEEMLAVYEDLVAQDEENAQHLSVEDEEFLRASIVGGGAEGEVGSEKEEFLAAIRERFVELGFNLPPEATPAMILTEYHNALEQDPENAQHLEEDEEELLETYASEEEN